LQVAVVAVVAVPVLVQLIGMELLFLVEAQLVQPELAVELAAIPMAEEVAAAVAAGSVELREPSHDRPEVNVLVQLDLLAQTSFLTLHHLS
jgi:hypothetical protein